MEELAAAYEQRLALLVMAAVLISGLVSLSIAGDYLYFGALHQTMPLAAGLLAVPVVAVVGAVAGTAFARVLLLAGSARLLAPLRRHPVLTAAACGLVVGLAAWLSGGLTWGTGYTPAKVLVEGGAEPWWFAPAKFAAAAATALSGIPGGIFAPSLSVGAGLGGVLAPFFPACPPGAIALIGMTAYFVGVVRAPLTAVIIIMEMTDSHGLLAALLATAIIAEGVSALLSRERLYVGLARPFRAAPPPQPSPGD